MPLSWRLGWRRRDDAPPTMPLFTVPYQALDTDYVLPHDMQEVNRLDFQHYLLRSVMRGLYAAPVKTPPSRILDVGCGTGLWAREMARAFPHAEVYAIDAAFNGRDISASEGRAEVPANYRFTQANVLNGLPFGDGLFDFVHQRLLIAGIIGDKWPDEVCELARVTAPGGWVELVEAAFAVNAGPATERLSEMGNAICTAGRIDIMDARRVGLFLENAGLTRVHISEVRIPLGPHGSAPRSEEERIGNAMTLDYIGAVEGMRPAAVKMGLVRDEAEHVMLCAQAKKEIPSYKGYCPFYVAYGQKAA